ncbi:MAG: asparaginase, partial [Muribaculaceae bacterium]|nr:asparaginase [Muribaculaceae bacterium]
MKILIVFTGGTIGSAVRGNFISADKKTPYKLIAEYEKIYGIDFEFDTVQPYTELSENNTGETISALIKCLKENIKNYDGVIVTHGTDTLQYTAAALSYAFGNNSVPVCIVSANYIIGDKRSNGLINFRGAVNFLRKKIGGVWVIYKNPDSPQTAVHRGTRLIESQTFSDCFYSVGNSFYGHFDDSENFVKNENYKEFPDEIPPIIPKKIEEKCDFILRIFPYVGMDFPQINSKIKYVIMGTFHSGTINTKS